MPGIPALYFFKINFLACCLSFITCWVRAQADIRFERITVEDGLSQSAITSMVQDKYGYLWIGTLDGLNRYDGSTFTVYREFDRESNSFPVHSVTKLFLDNDQRLWIAYRNGLSLYEPGKDGFKNYRIQVDERNWFIRDLDLVADSLLIVSTNFGIIDFNLQTGKAEISNEYLNFKDANVFDVVFIREKPTWVFTDKGLWRKGAVSSWIEFLKDENQLRAKYFERTGELYVRTENSLLKYDSLTDGLRLISYLPDEQWPSSTDMYKTDDGNLWVAHGSLSIFDKKDKLTHSLRHISQDPNSLSGAFVSDIFETRDDVVWVGTNGLGLNKYNPSRSVFGYLGNLPGTPLSLSDNYITSIYTDDDVTLFVSTIEGLNVVDLSKRKSKQLPVFGKDGNRGYILKVLKDKRGTMWLATNKGLMKFEGNSIWHSGISELDKYDLTIYDAAEANPFIFLLATNKGLIIWDQQQSDLTIMPDYGSLVLGHFANDFWFQSGENVKIMSWPDKKILKTFPATGSDTVHAPPATVKCLFQDSDKNIWIGTDGGGLSLYDSVTQTFTHIRIADGLSNDVVYVILEDNAGNLWLSTNEGLNVFDQRTKKFIRIFNKPDGLQGNEFNTRAYFKSPSGRMYFGGVNGLSFFDPADALKIPSFIPKTVLTGFYINNIKQDDLTDSQMSSLFGEHKIELNWNQRNFSFDIAGLGFTFPSGIQYQYKMEGFDKVWNVIGNQTRITFTNMPAGNYVLHVKSGNSFGDWEKEGLSVQIAVITPIWRSGWFIAGSISLFLGLGLFTYYQRTQFLKRRAIILQKIIEERTREIQRQREEIAAQNEELTSQAETLENSNIELEKRVEKRTNALKRLNKELADQNIQLEQFTFITAHNIRGPIARIKGLVNLLKSENTKEVVTHLEASVITLDEVITDLNAVLQIPQGINKKFELVPVKNQLQLVLHILRQDIESIQASMDLSEFEDVKIHGLKAYFQSIFYNLIHNALKYSDHLRKPVIKCSTVSSQDHVSIRIEDNGIGIDMRYAKDKIFKLHQRFHPNIMGKGYGLFLVKTQVKVMGGKIEVESEPDKGTRFSIEFPKAISER